MTREIYAQEIGDWIRDGRKELGLSQAELGEALLVSDSAISAWERGERMLDAYNKDRLKAFFKARKAELAAAAKAVAK